MTRVLFLSSFDYPSRYAHAIHGLSMAKAFAKLLPGKALFFVNASGDKLPPHRTLFGSFGRTVKKLHLRRLLLPFPVILFLLIHKEWRGKNTVLYTTDPALFGLCLFLKNIFGCRFAGECHGTLSHSQKEALSNANAAFFVTEGLRTRYSFSNGYTLPNAVDNDAFDAVSDSRSNLRKKLLLPEKVTLIGYIGRFEPLGHDKGLMFMIDALKDTPDTELLLLGGSHDEVLSYRAYAAFRGVDARVHIVGHVDASLVPLYAKACDALAYVPQEKNTFFNEETSPMKLFEYMAAERPILVSDTPALREALSHDEAFFIPQGNRDEYVHAVLSVKNDEVEAGRRAEKAYARAKGNTWTARAKTALSKII